jgi:hypothetical protein
MHDQLSDNLKKIVDSLNDAEKRELLERLKRSVEQGTPLQGMVASDDDVDTTAESQKRAWRELFAELALLPRRDEPDDGLSGSRDHDAILYGPVRNSVGAEPPN